MSEARYSNYGKALFDLVGPSDALLERYQKALRDISIEFEEHPEFASTLASYAIPFQDLYKLVDEAFSHFELEHLAPFMKLLVNKRLINHFSEIRASFNSYANGTRGVKEGVVYSVSRLTSAELESLSKSLAKRLKCEVELTNRLEPSLIGGVRIYIDDKVFDGSIETRLENLRSRLLNS